MTHQKTLQHKSIVGPKAKGCIFFTQGYMLILTYVVLTLHKNIIIQAVCLALTIFVFYIQLLLIQDYYYLRLHSKSVRSRKDIRLLEPIIPERFKIND